MEETFHQKVLRNIQGKFNIFKTPEVAGEANNIPYIEWEDTENIDLFFQFAKQLDTSILYVSEGEDVDEETQQTSVSIVQVGFLHQGIMHLIDMSEDEIEDEQGEDDEEEIYEEDYDEQDDEQDENEADYEEDEPQIKQESQNHHPQQW